MADGATSGIVRALPHNIEAEQALVGAILLDNRAFERVVEIVEREDFYDPVHGLVFKMAGDFIAAGKVANPITLRSFFEHGEPANGVSVPEYIGRLAKSGTTVFSAADYARTIKDLSTRRKLISAAEDILTVARDAPHDYPPEKQIEDAEAALFSLAPKGKGDQLIVSASQAMDEVIEAMAAAYESGGACSGISTGFPSIDAEIGGMDSGDLVIIAGRPSMGKSALAANIANNIARSSGPVLFFSQEMSAAQIMLRALAQKAGMSISDLRKGRIDEHQFKAALEAAKTLSKLPLSIDQTGGLTLPRLTAKARRVLRRFEHAAIVIDYLQLMHGGSRYAGNRNNELAEITTGLKAFGKEMKLPIILLSQLSREGAKRDNKRPQLTDLRDSGAIEQDADVVMMVHRPEYYLEREMPSETEQSKYMDWQAEMMAAKGKAEVILAKARQGKAGGIVNLKFDGPTTAFSELAA